MGESVYASTCQGCLSNCSVLVHVEDGRVTKVEGNSHNAATKGAVCPTLKLTLEQLTDPDRVTTPLRRTNPIKKRGEDPGFEPISWDEALGIIADRLLDLRRCGESHKAAIMKGRSTLLGNTLCKAFGDIYGTPNQLNHDGICAEAEKQATWCLDGVCDYHDYDLENTRCLLLWGTDPLASNRQKSRVLSAWPSLRKQALTISINPSLTLTGSRCDTWLAPLPGTDGALALAMAHVILAEGQWNRDFVGDFADGANRFVAGQEIDEKLFVERNTFGLVTWWNESLKDATPKWATEITGVAEADIVSTARGFAEAGEAAVSWVSPGVTMSTNGIATGMACYALNGLAGSLGSEGGVLNFPSAPTAGIPSTVPYQDEAALHALSQPRVDSSSPFGRAKGGKLNVNMASNHVADVLLNDLTRLDTLIAYWTNMPFSCTGARRWEQALERLPFLVHLTTNPSEMTHYADIVLPAKMHLFEDWGLAKSRAARHACVSMSQPCVESPGQCFGDETDFAFMLAQKMAEKGFDALARYYAECISPIDDRVPQTGRELAENMCQIMTLPLWDGTSPNHVEGCNSWSPARNIEDVARAWSDFLQAGVWNSYPAPTGQVAFATPSGKFEFASLGLQKLLEGQPDLAQSIGFVPSQTTVPIYVPPRRIGNAEEFPLVLTQTRSRLSLEGRSANTPSFQKLKNTDPGDEAWDDVIKLHPSDMYRFGLADGDTVLIESIEGSITCHVKGWNGTRPGVTSKCYGQGHWAYGHVAALDFEKGIPRGGNANEIIPAAYENLTGATARHGGVTRVRFTKMR